MKLIVLNGSPKGDVSITMEYVKYLENNFKEHEFKIINIAQRINQIEKNASLFHDIIDEIKLSDGVLWAFPLYYCLVCSQYKRFIELIFERKAESAFSGKYAAILTTSVNFMDHTAINYVNSICDDLNMKYVDYFSAHMYDLKKASIRRNLITFMENYLSFIENRKVTYKSYLPLSYKSLTYKPEKNYDKINTAEKKIIIVTDSLEDENLKIMLERFKHMFSEAIELINLQDIAIKGGCLGCIKCAYDNHCVYDGKDDFIDFYNNKIKNSDIIIFAGSIKDRYLSSAWKRYFDRSFFNNHTPSISGKQIGFIISGPLKQLPNLTQILDVYSQWQQAHIAGFVTDEYETSAQIDDQLYCLADKVVSASLLDYHKPKTFLGVGGWKIFRDEMWGELRFPFIADHKAYKTMKIYDFPQKHYKSRLSNFILICLTKIPVVRKAIYSNKIKTEMLKPIKNIR